MRIFCSTYIGKSKSSISIIHSSILIKKVQIAITTTTFILHVFDSSIDWILMQS